MQKIMSNWSTYDINGAPVDSILLRNNTGVMRVMNRFEAQQEVMYTQNAFVPTDFPLIMATWRSIFLIVQSIIIDFA